MDLQHRKQKIGVTSAPLAKFHMITENLIDSYVSQGLILITQLKAGPVRAEFGYPDIPKSSVESKIFLLFRNRNSAKPLFTCFRRRRNISS